MDKKPSNNAISAWAELFAAYRNLRHIAETELSRAQLPPLSWYDILWAVYRSPGKRVRQYLIGEGLLLEKHYVSRVLDRLEQEGLIFRQSCNEDRRGKHIQITDEGVALLKNMWTVYGKVIQDAFAAHFSENDLHKLSVLLMPLQNGKK